jgi:hypothetical protein
VLSLCVGLEFGDLQCLISWWLGSCELALACVLQCMCTRVLCMADSLACEVEIGLRPTNFFFFFGCWNSQGK